jgi:hypothetical protein
VAKFFSRAITEVKFSIASQSYRVLLEKAGGMDGWGDLASKIRGEFKKTETLVAGVHSPLRR